MRKPLLTLSFAILLAVALVAFAGPQSGYPNAVSLSGSELMLSLQSGQTVNITPAQILAYVLGAPVTIAPSASGNGFVANMPSSATGFGLVVQAPSATGARMSLAGNANVVGTGDFEIIQNNTGIATFNNLVAQDIVFKIAGNTLWTIDAAVLTAAKPVALPRYSASGTPAPSCVAGLHGSVAVATDATTPTYNGTYTSGGAVEVLIECNGSTWTTH